MDSTRGIAILLVVLFHSTGLPQAHAGVQANQFVLDASTIFAPYRMSVLFLLSGLLLERSLQKPWGTYAWGKVRALVWPFLVWMLIGRFIEGYTDVGDPMFWYPNNWLWFIAYLAVYYAVAPLVTRVPGRWLAIVPVACWLASAAAPTEDSSKLLYFAGFFFLGHLAARMRPSLRRLERTRSMVGCLIVAAALSAVLVARDHGVHDLWRTGADAHRPLLAPVVVIALAGLIMLLRRTTAPGERASAPTRWLRFLGQNAVVFYLVNFPVQVFVSLRLADAGISSQWIALPLCFVSALAAGLLACALRRFRLVDALFVAPGPTRRPSAALQRTR
ncbi:acyltransferase family protein [Herbiconiux liukaitaii]|uniref:acyltransferase family protein n=1 Tax=Herbiconiux liukaitaii TaxID=3342799 RepID=UPI0035B86CA8